jgi:NDP-sugar pyrophosphorylase family protein
MKIVLPMAGKPRFYPSDEYKFSRSFVEVGGKPMIQQVLTNLKTIANISNFVFIVNKQDIVDLHLDNVLKMLTEDKAQIFSQSVDTKGAVCSLLLGIEYIDCDEPIIISNVDQIIDVDLNEAIKFFQSEDCDAGVITFDSVHPQWSYVRTIEGKTVVEAAEKRPVSRSAIAGFYYYKTGKAFMQAAMSSIIKDRSVNGLYYTSLTLNEVILAGGSVKAYEVPAGKYHSFYSPTKVDDYEALLKAERKK